MKNNEDQKKTWFFNILQQNNLTPEQRRRFFLAILGDEDRGVRKLTQPGSLQHTAISNVIALLNDNCQDIDIWNAASRDAAAIAMSLAARAADAWDAGDAGDAWAADAARAAADAWVVTWPGWKTTWAELWPAAAAARAVGAAAARDAAARDAHYQWMADTLTQLMKEDT